MEQEVKDAINASCDLFVVKDSDEKHCAQFFFEQHGDWKEVRYGQLDSLTIATVGEIAQNKLRGRRYHRVAIALNAPEHAEFSTAYKALLQITALKEL